MNTRPFAFALLIAAAAAATDGLDARGWHTGTPAAGVARVLGAPETPTLIDLPAKVAKQVKGDAFLWYFSPGCPHCQAVAPEIQAMATRLAGRAEVIGVASSHADRAELDTFKASYGVTHLILQDTDGAFASAIGASMTPSSLLVRRDGSRFEVRDLWYPFSPGTSPLVEMRLSDTPWSVFERDKYLGTTTCAACHTEETDAWLLTHHSVAWRTLVSRDEHENAECTGCHVVGADKAGGWKPGDHLLVDVGCEACHGPGGPHDGGVTDARAACEGCHDEKHSIEFSIERALPHIDHFAATGMSEADWITRRRALANGEAERPLTRFPSGETVGSEACAGCHAGEHAQWQTSPHRQAMSHLAGENPAAAKDPTCVRCHATAKSIPAPSELAGFRLDDGVGCESCHGPGKRHVDAGGAPGTIEGLGDDCPVCVIEAVCTSCHTKAWDPDWDLKTDLPRAGHGSPTPHP